MQKSAGWGQKFLIGFLYFVQGIFLVIPSTITLTYKEIPPYGILAYFSAVYLPFSFKFLIGTRSLTQHL